MKTLETINKLAMIRAYAGETPEKPEPITDMYLSDDFISEAARPPFLGQGIPRKREKTSPRELFEGLSPSFGRAFKEHLYEIISHLNTDVRVYEEIPDFLTLLNDDLSFIKNEIKVARKNYEEFQTKPYQDDMECLHSIKIRLED